MKNLFFILLSSLLLSCSRNDNALLGTWRSDNGYHRAIYKIIEQDSQIKGLVLYYNDDTTVYTYDEKETYYVFGDLEQKGRVYTDARSGATENKSAQRPIRLELFHRDTLQVTTYVMNEPLKEFWIRKHPLK